MSSEYQFAPIFLIRMAGVPFESIEQLATTDTAAAARQLLVRQKEFAKAKSITNLDEAESRLGGALKRDLDRSRRLLASTVEMVLPAYLVFVNQQMAHRLLEQVSLRKSQQPRNKEARAHERTAVLYLQRLCAKNDSLSAFGPGGWGKIDNGCSGGPVGRNGLAQRSGYIKLAPEPGIRERETFLERWTAHGAAAALNADPEIRSELAPRLDPNCRLDGDNIIFTATGKVHPLDFKSVKILRQCDGRMPAHSLGVDTRLLENLAKQNMIRWEMEVPALDPYAFETLVRGISQWRDSPVRQRWLELLQPIADLAGRFCETPQTAARVQIMNEAETRLNELGARHAASGRFLYAATNPIGEECLRECNFSISENLIDEVATDAAPWIDLWRDCYAFVASRVAAGLRQIFETGKERAIPLPAFLQLCEDAKLPLTGPGLVALAHIAFQEIKAAFRELMGPHANQAAYNLTADDCHFVRRNFRYEKFEEFTYPSADLQLAAKSVEAVARGDYQWILAELHPPVALLHHGFYWSCPDKRTLSDALAATVFDKPSFYFGFSAADFTATTTVRFFDALPDLNYFVAPQRANPNWRTISPAETEVYIDSATADVCLRKIENHQYLGSFVRGWLIPLGFHPFQFGMAPHMPRLRCGRIIVQRRAWTIMPEELGKGDFTGVSRDLVLAVERLRAARDLPRFVYIRPTEQALRRSGAEGRDKDTKPVFIDLESYLFLEIFLRWLTKAGEIEVTEMLPAPDQLLWREADSESVREGGGRRTFELRTLIIPRK